LRIAQRATGESHACRVRVAANRWLRAIGIGAGTRRVRATSRGRCLRIPAIRIRDFPRPRETLNCITVGA
jgi:hypothetical protein